MASTHVFGRALSACALTGTLAFFGCAATGDGSTLEGGLAEDDGGTNLGSGGGPGGIGSGGGSTSGGSCAEVSETAQNQVQPSDIVLAIDQSGSMDTETNWVKNQLNDFASQITQSGIDVQVVVIAGKPGSENGFCVPAPLGSGSCPADDNLPTLLHVDQHVDSHDALAKILSTHSVWASSSRPGAAKHFIAISDDDAEGVQAIAFDAAIKQLDPSFADYTFHAIVADYDCSVAADEGKEYKKLVSWTGGVLGDLCQQNFQPVWDAVSTQVIAGASLACQWDIPDPPDGSDIDPSQVNVELSVDGGPATPLGYVSSPSDCGSVQGGWYYDDPANPQTIHVCPDVCDQVQNADDASVNIQFGCQTQAAPPK